MNFGQELFIFQFNVYLVIAYGIVWTYTYYQIRTWLFK